MKRIDKEKILIGPSTFAQLDKTPLEKLISKGYDVVDNPFKRKLTEDELIVYRLDCITFITHSNYYTSSHHTSQRCNSNASLHTYTVSMITLLTGTSQKGLDPHLATFLTKRCVTC